MDEKVLNIVNELIAKTDKKEVAWSRFGNTEMFYVRMKSGILRIERRAGLKDRLSILQISIVNSNGDTIYRFSTGRETYPQDFDRLKSLHEKAKRSFFKVDDAIDSLLEEIDSSQGQIGTSTEESRPSGTSSGLSVIYAKYGVEGKKWIDVTATLDAAISGGQLRLEVQNSFLGEDPAHGVWKDLIVVYKINDKINFVQAIEGDSVTIDSLGSVVISKGSAREMINGALREKKLPYSFGQ